MIRGDVVREYIRGSLWVLPTASTILALLLGTANAHMSVAAFGGPP